MTALFPFDNSYARLPSHFFGRVAPTAVEAPRLIRLNRALAVDLGLDPDRLESPEGVEVLAGRRVPEGAEPLAAAYAGHQFGQFVPQLGDGRAILLGWARSSVATGAAISNSKVLARPRFPAGATGAPPSVRCCASISSARRCTPWAFRPPARWRP
jgi:hypothetical protein